MKTNNEILQELHQNAKENNAMLAFFLENEELIKSAIPKSNFDMHIDIGRELLYNKIAIKITQHLYDFKGLEETDINFEVTGDTYYNGSILTGEFSIETVISHKKDITIMLFGNDWQWHIQHEKCEIIFKSSPNMQSLIKCIPILFTF
jgi:hypothetical protein